MALPPPPASSSPAEWLPPPPGAPPAAPTPRLGAIEAPPRVLAWLNSLLDLSYGNPLIDMKPGRHAIQIEPGPEGLAALENRVMASGNTVEMFPVEGKTDELDAAITRLKRKAREIESQTGSNNLFLAIGSITWTAPHDDRTATSPLFLIPIRITGSATSAFRMSADDGVEVTPNYCLVEKLRRTFDLEIPDLETPDLDDAGIDVDRTIAAVRRALAARHLDDIVVSETAHVAVLNFANFRLWKDMREHWPTFLSNDVVRHLVESPGETFVDAAGNAPIPDDLLCPIEIDESQLQAVQWAAAGRSFVIEGPPGTGKSQTITNLLAACIAANRRVLFVAQKQPALQVVKKRLEQIGLTPFCIDLHDKGSKPDDIRRQIRDALDFTGVDRESEWAELSARLLSDELALGAYRDAIHGTNPAGYSAWSARQELDELGPGEAAVVPDEFVTSASDRVPAVRDALLELPSIVTGERIDPGAPWALCGRDDFEAIDQTALAGLVARLQTALDTLSRLPAQPKQALARLAGPTSLSTAIATIELSFSAGAGVVGEAELASVGTPTWAAQRDAALARLDEFQVTHAVLLSTLREAVFATDLGPIIEAGSEAATAGLLSRGKKERVFDLLVAPVLADRGEREPAELVGLLQQVEPARSDAEEVATQLRTVPALRLPTGWSAIDAADVVYARTRLGALEAEAQQLRAPDAAGIRAACAAGWVPDQPTMTALRDAAHLWNELTTALSITPESTTRWRNGRGFFEAWATANPVWASAAPRFLALQRWCDVVRCVRPVADAGLGDLAADLLDGTADADGAYDRFRRGLVTAALNERLVAGRADQFDGRAHDRRVAQFISRDGERRELLRAVIPYHLVQDRPFRPGARFGEYGALERELSKTTRRMSIRSLVQRYGEILPTLTPCFLMSPDSVARFLPPGSVQFDLVVFDEASQIEVAEAIGAMGRARAVVVVGDSKQMPPSTFGGALPSTEAEAEDQTVIEDLESILSECVESNLPRLYLRCHYRSRHEGLIAFSNAAFYEGRLTTFPSPKADGPAPIHWRRVNGHFDRAGEGTADTFRTNRVEADAIVAEIVARLDDPARAGQSICVVTLNVQQQALVLQLLEGHDERIRALLDDETDAGLIVRNLESVQGDERDVVLISVAFAAIDGKLPLHFGPLNRIGGERRLNVAITRARQEVVVFCSFDPEDMQLGDTPAKGLELLKAYLSMARDGLTAPGVASLASSTAPARHRDEIADALRERGVRVRTDVGLSAFRVDLAVGPSDSEDWTVAVLLDGPAWSSRATVYDRDALPVHVLAMMGWPRVVRVWLPSWLQERDRVLDEIVAATRRPEPPAVSVVDLPPPPVGPIAEPSADPVVSDHEMEFVAAAESPLGARDVLDRLDEPDARDLVERAIAETLATEAPIHATRLAKIVATRFGFEQVRQNRIDDILELATQSYTRRSEFGVFLWATDVDADAWTRYRRTPAGVERQLDQIAPEEIANAMVDIAAMSHTITVDELTTVVGGIFGARKVSTVARTHLEAVVAWAVGLGRLEEVDGGLRTP